MKKEMKKIITLLLITGLVFTGCAGGTAKQPNPSDVTKAVIDEVEFATPVEKTIENITDFFDVDTSKLDAVSAYVCGSGASPDELAVFKFKKNEDAAAAKTVLQSHLDEQVELYSSYTPKEMYKLDSALLVVKDNYVILAVTSDNNKANEIINSYF